MCYIKLGWEAWQKANHRGLCYSAKGKIDEVLTDLQVWDKQVLKGPRTRLRKAQKDLEALTRLPFSTEVSMKQKELAVLIENLLEQDEIYWAQRGRVSWLRRGDRNSSYF